MNNPIMNRIRNTHLNQIKHQQPFEFKITFRIINGNIIRDRSSSLVETRIANLHQVQLKLEMSFKIQL